jgi:hypothetical protein
MTKKLNRYASLIVHLFKAKYRAGSTRVPFAREELVDGARRLGIALPKNIGDVIYSQRYRAELPDEIAKTASAGKTWIILGVGIAKYEFRLLQLAQIAPNVNMATIKIPDATPQIVANYAQTDEQALLAKVRYNRLIDIFLGIATFSLQNHLRTTVEGIGQVELDEVYVGVDKAGQQYVVPVQAKGGSDKHSAVQTLQDIACCAEKFPKLICRPISAQFAADDVIAIFELTEDGDSVKILEEKHYKLVPSKDITDQDLASYRKRSRS